MLQLTRFGDREFYKDWWNAATIGDYWKLWNMPVHKWLLRTIYFPAMNHGVNRWAATTPLTTHAMRGKPLHQLQLLLTFYILYLSYQPLLHHTMEPPGDGSRARRTAAADPPRVQ